MNWTRRFPTGPIEKRWDKHRFDMKLVNPANKRKYDVIVVGIGPGRRLGRGHAGRARLQRQVLLLPGQPAPRPLHRRPGRHQRRQELPERRRQRLPAVLRHGQGRRLPLPRGQRLPPGRGQRQHHRPVRRPGRALRPRVRRPARQPLVRRRPGVAHLLRPRPDRPAAAARRLPGAAAADRPPARCRCIPRTEMLDLVVVDGHAARHRHPRPGHRRDRVATRPTRSSSPPAATATSSTCRPTPRAATSRPPGAPTSAAPCFANPCYTQIHPTCIPVSGDYQSKLTLMSESLRNDGRVWVPKKAGDKRAPDADPRRRARLLPRAQVPELRQPGAARHRLARRQGGLRRGPRRRARAAAASTSTSPTPSSASARTRSDERYGNLFDMYERITGEDPYKVPMRIYPAVALHDGRALGGLQPDEHHSRACSCSARPTSPTTAPTASAPAR